MSRRIPLHDHTDGNSGGKLTSAATTTVVSGGVTTNAAVSFGVPVAVGTALVEGATLVAARSDHIHTNTYLGTVVVYGTAGSAQVLTAQGAGSATWAAAAGGASVVFKDEGATLGTPTVVDFVGAGVTATGSGTVTVTISGGTTTASIITQDEGSTIGTASVLNWVGAGVSAAYSGGTTTVTVAGGGAPTTAKYVTTASDGTLSAEVVRPQLGNYFAETYPASPDATYDDEFDDSSGMSGSVNGLNARWGWRNQGSATVTWGTAGWLSLNCPAQASNNFRIIEISAFADGTYEACIGLTGGQNLGVSKGEHGGVVLIDSTNGDFYVFGLVKDNTTVYYGLQKWTNVTTFSANTALVTFGTNFIPPRLFIRITKSGTTLSWYYSVDGIAWTLCFTETDSVSATRIGLCINESRNTGTTKMLVDYFRKTA